MSAVTEGSTTLDDCKKAKACSRLNKENVEDKLTDSANKKGRGGCNARANRLSGGRSAHASRVRGGRSAQANSIRGRLGGVQRPLYHLSKDSASTSQRVGKSQSLLVLDKNDRCGSTSAAPGRITPVTTRAATRSGKRADRPEPRTLVPLKKRKIGSTLVVDRIPGRSVNVVGARTVTQSPGGLKELETPSPLCNALEIAEVVDLCAEEVEEVVATNKRLQPQDLITERHVPIIYSLDNPKAIRCADYKPSVLESCAITASSSVAGPCRNFASPELSARATNTLGQTHVGTGMDINFGDDFDITGIISNVGTLSRQIPDDAELEAPVRAAIRNMEEVMDANHEDLLGINNRFDWVEDFGLFRGRREQFVVASPGPTEMFASAYKAFVAIWDRDFMEMIALETNRYAEQVIERKTENFEMTTKSRLHDWKETNVEELYIFFAVFIYMGLAPRANLDEYWTTDSVLELTQFRQLMSCSRYILLNKFLHFVDNSDASRSSLHNEGTQLSPQLYKIASVINHLNSKFQNLYILGKNIAIDESLTLFKGRMSWIQSIRSKASRFGTKSFELCESSTGYLYKFIIYQGNDSDNPEVVMPGADLGSKSTSIVLDLLEGLEHKGYCVTTDNFYNSPSLARYLKSLGFDCVGTLRANRKHVPEAIAKLQQNVDKGTIVARHCGDVSVLAWKDVKVVNMISTYHDASTFVGSKGGNALVKPESVGDYHNAMRGIDSKYQKLSKYLLVQKRGVKWYMNIFRRLLNASIFNAYILCRHSWSQMKRPVLTHREFRYQLAHELIKYHNVSSVARSITDSPVTRLRIDIVHVPKYISGSTKRRRCPVCTAVGRQKKVISSCVTCDVGLCFGDCWIKYHTLPDLKALSK